MINRINMGNNRNTAIATNEHSSLTASIDTRVAKILDVYITTGIEVVDNKSKAKKDANIQLQRKINLNKKTEIGIFGKTYYLIVKTENFLKESTAKFKVSIKSKEKLLSEKDAAINVTIDDKDSEIIELTLGNYYNDKSISNAKDFENLAIAKFSFNRETENDRTTDKKLISEATNKKALLYLEIESVENHEGNIEYCGDQEKNDKKAFHYEHPYGLVNQCICNRDIEIDEIIDLIYHLRDKEKYVTHRDKFFDLNSEYISSVRIDSGKITENRDKIKLFTDEMNTMFEKFNINSCKRKIHFIAQMYLETNRFRATYEGWGESNTPTNYRGGYYFQGKGMKQITHNYNYLAYYDYINSTTYFKTYLKYRSVVEEDVEQTIKDSEKAQNAGLTQTFYDDTLKPFAKNLSENLFHAFNSAGWYSTINRPGVLRAMDAGLADSNVINVTQEINGGQNGITERKNFTKWLKEHLKYDTECVSD